ncbi:MAG: site-specific DNA-methyltransferase, partial [Chloroflexi bacterium]|nr:site-specific DNA-methyltransferase [Chloroflexota bacterium]
AGGGGGGAGIAELGAPLARYRPKTFRSRIPLFSEPVEAKFLWALSRLAQLPSEERDLVRIALGAVMISVSNYTYEPSLGSRPGAGKPLIPNASLNRVLRKKLSDMVGDIGLVRTQHRTTWQPRRRNVIQGSYFRSEVAAGSISLVVTSPPYMNNYHYLRNTRPQLHWLGLIDGTAEQHRVEQDNVGTFWQTVRDRAPVNLGFVMPELNERIKTLRQTNAERGAYGGPGWANYVATYFNDLDRFVGLLGVQLAPGASAVIVIGNSITQGVEFKVDQLLASLAERNGLSVDEIRVLRTKRVGDSIVNSSVRNGEFVDRRSARLYDSVVVLRRVGGTIP